MERRYKISEKFKEFFNQVISVFFILLFIYAAVTQLSHMDSFKSQLKQFPFVNVFATWLAWIIPAVLILISLLFLFTRLRRLGLLLAFILMLMFSIYFVAVLGSGIALPCSCRGIITSLSWEEHLVFNIGSTSLALLGLTLTAKNETNPPP